MFLSRLSGRAAGSRLLLLALLGCCFCHSARRVEAARRQSGGGRLSQVRSEVREERSDDSDHDEPPRSKRRRSSGGGAHVLSSIGFHVYEEPCWVEYGTPPPVVSNPAPAGPNYFASLPYADPLGGALVPTTKLWAARSWFEYGFETQGVERWSASVLIEEVGGWGIDGDWNVYTEDLGAEFSDQLRIGDLNLTYRLIDTENTQWRAGVGMNWLEDTVESDYGVNFTLGVDLYPARPWVISAEVDWGTVGATDMLHASAIVGASWDRLEVFGGYDYRQIGTVSLAGPMVGLRIRF